MYFEMEGNTTHELVHLKEIIRIQGIEIILLISKMVAIFWIISTTKEDIKVIWDR